MSLSTRPLCSFLHYWNDVLITRLSSWLCSQLVQTISVISLLPCQMCNWPVFLAHILLWCPPRLCPRSTPLRHIHHSPQYPHFLLFPKPPHICRWHSALYILPSDSLDSSIDHLYNALDRISSCMTANLLTLNSSKTEFLVIDLSKQLAKINNSSLTTTHSAPNLGFIFDKHITFSDQISSVSKSCYYHILQPRCIRPYLDTIIASTIVTSIVLSKLHYCNSLYHNLPKSQITRLQQIQNSLTRAVVKAAKSSHITPILCRLKVTERIEYNLTSSSHLPTKFSQPSNLHICITSSQFSQTPRSTHSSSLVTLARPSTSSSLWITDRSFQYASSRLRNQPRASLRQPRTNLSNSASPSSLSGSSSISSINSPLSLVNYPFTIPPQA